MVSLKKTKNPFANPSPTLQHSREWESRAIHCRVKEQRGDTKSDAKPPWEGLETGQDLLSAPEGQQSSPGATALQCTTQGGANCRHSLPSPAGNIPRGALAPQGASSLSRAAGRPGHIPGLSLGTWMMLLEGPH